MIAPARRVTSRIAAALLCVWLPSGPAAAEESYHLFAGVTATEAPESDAAALTPSFGHLLSADLRRVATSPEWLGPRGWIAAAVVVGGALMSTERGDVDPEGLEGGAIERQVATLFEPLGESSSIAVLGGFLLVGTIRHDSHAKQVAVDGAIASLIASGLITPALKEMFGRSRPHQAASATDFHPFNGHASFPSGHTTQAFAVASVIAHEYDSRWVDVAAYGSATLVGYSRVLHDAHYVSDVLAGALIGTLVGRTVATYNRRLRRHRVTVAPVLGPDGAELAVGVHFRDQPARHRAARARRSAAEPTGRSLRPRSRREPPRARRHAH